MDTCLWLGELAHGLLCWQPVAQTLSPELAEAAASEHDGLSEAASVQPQLEWLC